MLHQVNPHFPGTDPVFNRAANIQTASEVQLHGGTGFRNQSRKPQTNRNIKKIGKEKHMLAWPSHDLSHFLMFFLIHLPDKQKTFCLKRGKTTWKPT